MSFRRLRLTAAGCATLAAAAAPAAERVMLGEFSTGHTRGWEAASFDDIPASDDDLVGVDGRTVLRGRCDDSASVFGIEREVDLTRTPVLHWSWRMDGVYQAWTRAASEGMIFRPVYAEIDGGWLPWRTRAQLRLGQRGAGRRGLAQSVPGTGPHDSGRIRR